MSIMVVRPTGSQGRHLHGCLYLEPLTALHGLWEASLCGPLLLWNETQAVLLVKDRSVRLKPADLSNTTLLTSLHDLAEQNYALVSKILREQPRLAAAANNGLSDRALIARWMKASGNPPSSTRPIVTLRRRKSDLKPFLTLLFWCLEHEDPSSLRESLERWLRETELMPCDWLRVDLLLALEQLYRQTAEFGKAKYLEAVTKGELQKLVEPTVRERSEGRRQGGLRAMPTKSQHHQTDSLRLTCLGPPSIFVAGKLAPVTGWRTRKALSLFFYLALSERQASADTLQEVIWPGRGVGSRRNFQTTVSRIRRTFSDIGVKNMIVRSRGGLYSLRHFSSLHSDKDEFERAAKALLTDSFSLPLARETLALYKGPFLEGVEDLWVLQKRAQLLNLWNRLAQRTVEAELGVGKFARAEQLAETMLSFDGSKEEAHLCKIRTLLAAGRVGEATEAYQRFEKILKQSTGLKPSSQALLSYRDWKEEAVRCRHP